MQTPTERAIERFYAAFGRCDGAAMTACYAPDAHFRDPAFGDLEGNEIGAMWRMLTGRATDLEIELHEHEAGEDSGSAHWIARYTFSTGRPVVNDIQAKFRFADGLIADHVDDFDFRNWAKQALGPMRESGRRAAAAAQEGACPGPRPARRVHRRARTPGLRLVHSSAAAACEHMFVCGGTNNESRTTCACRELATARRCEPSTHRRRWASTSTRFAPARR